MFTDQVFVSGMDCIKITLLNNISNKHIPLLYDNYHKKLILNSLFNIWLNLLKTCAMDSFFRFRNGNTMEFMATVVNELINSLGIKTPPPFSKPHTSNLTPFYGFKNFIAYMRVLSIRSFIA